MSAASKTARATSPRPGTRRIPRSGRVSAEQQATAPATTASTAVVLAGRNGRGRAGASIVVGGPPRVDLLPAEVHVDRRQRAVVRRVWAGVVVVAIATVIATAGASLTRASAANDLEASRAATTSLLQQQAQYSDVRSTESATKLLEAGQEVGGSTEIDWSAYLTSVQASLPAGVQITGVTIDSASPLAAYAQAEDPLQGSRIATLTFDAESPSLPSIPTWLDSVKGLTGFVDANANSVTRGGDTGVYTVNMTVHIDDEAFDGKYAADKGE